MPSPSCRRALRCVLLGLVALLAAGSATAQIRKAEFKIHDRGELWETMKDDGTIGAPNPTNRFEFYPSMDWPGGPHTLPNKDDQRSYNVGAGLWIGGRRNGTLFFTENGPFTYVDQGTFSPIERTDNFVEAAGYDPAHAEQTIVARFTTTERMQVTRTSRVWSFRGLNNFVLLEYVLTNVGAEPLSDVYVGFPYLLRPSYQDFVVHNGWGDDFNRADELVGYDTSRAMVYAWDDTPNFSIPTDVGNYWDDAQELRTTGFAGVSVLEAPPAIGGGSQPAGVLVAQLLNNEHLLSVARRSKEDLYALLSGADRSLQAPSGTRLAPFILLSYGPYAVPPGGSLRFALVQAVAGLSLTEALKGLSAQPALGAGLDSLRHTVDRARVLHAAGYRVGYVPPPTPSPLILPLPSTRSISLTWAPVLDQSWVDPLSGSRIAEYRVYRSDRSFIGPFRQIARVRVNNEIDINRYFDRQRNEWKVIDNTVQLGARYVYAITAVDEEKHESWLTNRNETPVTVTSSPAADALNVRVFPNPFREVSGFPTRGDENSIVWTNLPERATIRIYTSSGELVRVIEHDDPQSGQAVWDQLSDARQRTAPGIYFWAVTSDVGEAAGTLLIIK